MNTAMHRINKGTQTQGDFSEHLNKEIHFVLALLVPLTPGLGMYEPLPVTEGPPGPPFLIAGLFGGGAPFLRGFF